METHGNSPIHPFHNMSAIELGLTKREHFAAMAMQAIITGTHSDSKVLEGLSVMFKKNNEMPANYIASAAIEYADALIEELNKTK